VRSEKENPRPGNPKVPSKKRHNIVTPKNRTCIQRTNQAKKINRRDPSSILSEGTCTNCRGGPLVSPHSIEIAAAWNKKESVEPGNTRARREMLLM